MIVYILYHPDVRRNGRLGGTRIVDVVDIERVVVPYNVVLNTAAPTTTNLDITAGSKTHFTAGF